MANLTARELASISDHLAEEQVLVKKYRAYAASATDQSIKTSCEQWANRHQDHYDRLYAMLG